MKQIVSHIKKHLWKYGIGMAALAVLVGVFIPFNASDIKPEGYYTEADVFFKNVDNEWYHTEFANQAIYYATRGKVAKDNNRRRYATIGWQITAEANGYSMYIELRKPESEDEDLPLESLGERRPGDKYAYELYKIDYSKLVALMESKDAETWAKISNGEEVIFYMDAIMSIKKKGNDNAEGELTQNKVGNEYIGTVTNNGSEHIYYMRDVEQRDAIQALFNSNLEYYYGLEQPVDTPLLTVQYKIENGITVNGAGYSIVSNGLIGTNGKVYKDYAYRFQYFKLRQAGEGGFDLKKTGYHMPSGEEWMKEGVGGVYYGSGSKQFAGEFEPKVVDKNTTVTMVPNFVPNTYTIHYDANGGKYDASIQDTPFTYDKPKTLSALAFERDGYLQDGWIDANGNTYAFGQEVINMTTENEKTITLYANWKPIQITITTDKQGGSGGTDVFYQWYGIGNFSDSGYTDPITSISFPKLTGHAFGGYWTAPQGGGTQSVTDHGVITNAYFFKDTVVYAKWTPEVYKITLDNQGADKNAGTSCYYEKYSRGNYRDANGTDPIGNITVPQKTGHSFGGYYTEPNGRGIAYVGTNGKITSESTTFTKNTTLYAYWVPNVYEIGLDMQGGSGGTEFFFVKYGEGFFEDYNCETDISSITVPGKAGSIFNGYRTLPNSNGDEVIGYSGTGTTAALGFSNTLFTSNTILYADWEAVVFKITFDKQGGINGTSEASISTGNPYPIADAPNRGKYTFMGYYTGTKGTGECIYDKYMNTTKLYTLTTNQTLYAYWVDETAPTLNLFVDHLTWTNQDVTLTASASDYGSGLKSVYIYLLDDDGNIGATPVASAENLNGITNTQLTFVNQLEGVIRYKAIATDMDGLTSESINVVYYDKTPPTGTLVSGGKDGNIFEFEFDITDINPGN